MVDEVEAINITRLAHRDPATAAQIHAIQMAAYRQEAALLKVDSLPPLERPVAYVMQSADTFWGAIVEGELAGVVSVEPESAGFRMISSLVVDPAFQRRGVGAALLASVFSGGGRVRVGTAVGNAPALALYGRAGFVECKRWLADTLGLELIELEVDLRNRGALVFDGSS